MTPTYRVQFVYDQDAEFEECNGERRPLTEDEYAENEYMKDGKPVPYAGYLRYQGNPERHVYIGCDLQRMCPCCGHFDTVESLWHIDFMDDSPEYLHLQIDHFYSVGEIADDPKMGYLREVLKDLLSEAKHSEKG